MPGEITYYAIVGANESAQTPSGLARRRHVASVVVDEALRRDLTWQPDAAITEWEYGEVGADVVEISEAAAEQVLARFRAAWDQPA